MTIIITEEISFEGERKITLSPIRGGEYEMIVDEKPYPGYGEESVKTFQPNAHDVKDVIELLKTIDPDQPVSQDLGCDGITYTVELLTEGGKITYSYWQFLPEPWQALEELYSLVKQTLIKG